MLPFSPVLTVEHQNTFKSLANGVNLQASILLSFGTDITAFDDVDSPLPAGAVLATLRYGLVGESKGVMTIVGTKGRINHQDMVRC